MQKKYRSLESSSMMLKPIAKILIIVGNLSYLNIFIFPLLDGSETWMQYTTQEEKDRMRPEIKQKMLQVIGAKNALINKKLHKMQVMAGIDKKIAMHISHHSFAKMAKEKELDNLEVKGLLAYSNLATTQRYMGEFDTAHNDAALEKVFKPADQEDPTQKLLKELQSVDPTVLQVVLEKLKEGQK